MMLEEAQRRCFEFARLLLGSVAVKEDIESLTATVSSFDELCIALVLRYEGEDARARVVADVWRKRVGEKLDGNHINDLVHLGEVLATKQSELERQLRDTTKEMLEKLKVIDGLATLQTEMRVRLTEVNDLIGKFRQQSACIEGVVQPGQGASNEPGK